MFQRKTQQQTAVVQVLERASVPLSPHQVLVEAQKAVFSISQATVYRVLKGLLAAGTIATVQLPGEAPLYELAGKTHHHFFRCRQCEKMYEVKGCADLLKRLVPRGFTLEDHEVFLLGVCSTCRG